MKVVTLGYFTLVNLRAAIDDAGKPYCIACGSNVHDADCPVENFNRDLDAAIVAMKQKPKNEQARASRPSRSRRNRTSGKRGGARPGAGRKSEAERKKHQRDAQRRSRERRAKLAKKRPPRKRKPAARKRVRTPKPKPMTASERGEVAAHMSKL